MFIKSTIPLDNHGNESHEGHRGLTVMTNPTGINTTYYILGIKY